MFVQGFMGFIGTALIFGLLWLIVKIIMYIFFPEKVKSMLKKEIINLQEKKCELEAKVLVTEYLKEEIKTAKQLRDIEKKLNKLKQNLGEMTL